MIGKPIKDILKWKHSKWCEIAKFNFLVTFQHPDFKYFC